MKISTLFILMFLTLSSLSHAQTVNDTHPNASIYVIDYQSGEEVPATSDVAVLFKDALIDLVTNTTTAKIQAPLVPGHKSFTVTQVDPKTGYGFQLALQSVFLKQTITVYTFLYNVDQNTLYYFDKNAQDWAPQLVQGNNVISLNNCLELSKFNDPGNGQQVQQVADAGANDTAPIDTAVVAATQPPPLPDYDQPECPQDGYLWQPGYWAYSPQNNAYYWVPGAWVAPPDAGYLWTPPYWGYNGGVYVFHTGYWGNSIGFYGGINYGYGYGGSGYYGGEWRDGRFRYNTAVVRVNVNVVHNTYVNTTVINRTVVNNHVSFNGRGGVMQRPTPVEVQAMHQQHIMATPEQNRNQQIARADKGQFASPNGGGKPANLATQKVPERSPVINQNQRNNAPQNSRNFTPGSNNNGGNVTPNNSNGRNFNQGSNNRASNPNPPAVKQGAPTAPVPKPVMPGSAGGRPSNGNYNNQNRTKVQPVKPTKTTQNPNKKN